MYGLPHRTYPPNISKNRIAALSTIGKTVNQYEKKVSPRYYLRGCLLSEPERDACRDGTFFISRHSQNIAIFFLCLNWCLRLSLLNSTILQSCHYSNKIQELKEISSNGCRNCQNEKSNLSRVKRDRVFI